MQYWNEETKFDKIKNRSFTSQAYELIYDSINHSIMVGKYFQSDLSQISARSLYLLFCDYCKIQFGPMSECVLKELEISNGKQFKKILKILIEEGLVFCENVQFLDSKIEDDLDLTRRVVFTSEDWKEGLNATSDK